MKDSRKKQISNNFVGEFLRNFVGLKQQHEEKEEEEQDIRGFRGFLKEATVVWERNSSKFVVSNGKWQEEKEQDSRMLKTKIQSRMKQWE